MTSVQVLPTVVGERKQTAGEKEKGFTCYSKFTPYQALHDWLHHKPPGFPVATKKEGKKERGAACRTDRAASKKIALNSV